MKITNSKTVMKKKTKIKQTETMFTIINENIKIVTYEIWMIYT